MSLKQWNKEDAQDWMGFFLELEGNLNAFRMWDPSSCRPLGHGLGYPVIAEDTPAGSGEVETSGWPPNVINVLKAGDWAEFGGHFAKVVSSVNSGPDGTATIRFWPRPYADLTEDTPILLRPAKGIFRFVSDAPSWEVSAGGNPEPYSITLTGRQVVTYTPIIDPEPIIDFDARSGVVDTAGDLDTWTDTIAGLVATPDTATVQVGTNSTTGTQHVEMNSGRLLFTCPTVIQPFSIVAVVEFTESEFPTNNQVVTDKPAGAVLFMSSGLTDGLGDMYASCGSAISAEAEPIGDYPLGVVLSSNGAATAIYEDRQLVASGDGGTNALTGTVYLGNSSGAGSVSTMKFLRYQIYDQALTNDEVVRLTYKLKSDIGY